MAKKNKKPAVELNDDINWDYESYQGRSRRQVIDNENISFYVLLATVGFVIGFIFYWILSSI